MRELFKYGLAVIRNKKLLVVREKNTSIFLLPGGRPLNGEHAETALDREVNEELDSRLVRNSLTYFGDFKDVAANEEETIIHISLFLGEVNGDFKPSMEIEEIRWVGINTKILLAPSIKNKILPALINEGLVE